MSDVFDVLRNTAPPGESRMFCPACSKDRHNKRDTPLAVNNLGDRITYHCWHCDVQGAVRVAGAPPAPMPKKPKPLNRDEVRPLTEDVIEFFKDRGIGREVLEWAGMKTSHIGGSPAAAYPYPTKNPRGYKVRGIVRDEKGKRPTRIIGEVDGLFLQDRINDPLPVLAKTPESATKRSLSYDDLSYDLSSEETLHSYVESSYEELLRAHAREDQVVICEGEDDALSCIQAGIANATSVPHGAINEGTAAGGGSSKLAFISDQPDFWKPIRRAIIATDADGNGRAMMAEIARRLGRWRAWLVSWPDGCKDANDVLVADGGHVLAQIVYGAEADEVPGLYDAESFKHDLFRLRRGEIGRGESTGFHSLDPFFKIGPGITVVTGWPKSGKSDFVDQVHINLAERLGWKIGVWSPENPPHVHIAKLCEKRARKRFFPDMPNQMDEHALEEAYSFVRRHFKFVSLGGAGNTIEAILERFSAAVARDGCKSFVIDPYNFISKASEREDDFISNMLNVTREWQQAHEAHVFFVAHPKGVDAAGKKKDAVLTGHNISGGPTWWAKCDFGLTVHRLDFFTEVYVWACRNAHMGQNGMAQLQYMHRLASFEDRDTFTTTEAPAEDEEFC